VILLDLMLPDRNGLVLCADPGLGRTAPGADGFVAGTLAVPCLATSTRPSVGMKAARQATLAQADSRPGSSSQPFRRAAG
jgi:hypothetical protein